MNIVHTQYDVWNGRYRTDAANYRDWERDNFEKRLKVGNFVVLPNIPDGRNTINTYRGCHGVWHDFFDRFLLALRNILLGSAENIDEPLAKLVALNNAHFSPYRSVEGFDRLIKSLMLEDYLGTDGQPEVRSKGYYFWRTYGMSRDDDLAEAERYIYFSKQVIDRRSERIIAKLKSHL